MLRVCALFVLCSVGQACADIEGKVRVIDGDTFNVGGQNVRLFGVDAPEARQTCTGENNSEWACGAWVSRLVRELYQGSWAICEEVEKDRYDRSVATCSVKGADVGGELVSLGLAFAYGRYSNRYIDAEKRAAIQGIGLHGSALERPSDYRAAQRSEAQLLGSVQGPPDPNCSIKGNISSGGKIFHVEGQENYEMTRVDETKGERWFCSSQEALQAGWRPAKR